VSPQDARTPLRYRLNPCDTERYRVLAPVGDSLAALYDRFTAGTECACCLGMRLISLIVLTALGASAATLYALLPPGS
jgi:hypothetical protein